MWLNKLKASIHYLQPIKPTSFSRWNDNIFLLLSESWYDLWHLVLSFCKCIILLPKYVQKQNVITLLHVWWVCCLTFDGWYRSFKFANGKTMQSGEYGWSTLCAICFKWCSITTLGDIGKAANVFFSLSDNMVNLC